jgi:signal peptidase II
VSRRAALARAAAVALVVVAIDQAVKALVRATVERGESESIGLGVSIVNARNRGIAFGLFDEGGVALVAIVLVAVVAIVVFFALNAHRPNVWLPMGLLIGGAAGNLVDRVVEGSVTDFIDLPWWPAFNLADTSITVGVLGMLWVMERPREARRPG